MVDYPDIINFTHDELIEEYCKLYDRFQDLRESSEADAQNIHELKRSLDTATAAQAYLSQELEHYTNSDNNEIKNELHKTQVDLLGMKKKYGKLETSLNNLQLEYNALLENNTKLTQNLEASQKHTPKEVDTDISDEYLTRIQLLENENMDLLQKIEEFEESSVHYTFTIAEYEKKMEILRDQVMCLEENLQSKRLDLEEKVQFLESAQEQLAEANAKISLLSAIPDNKDRKGNSLFAEVDDQRQAMKQLLAAQKKNYLQMKKIYNESEHEIRRLKRENISMHTELEACSSIFCSADKIYQEKLNERIRHLLNQNEDLERKLKWTQDRLRELANEKGVLFLDSMLSLCKKETDDLKSQLHSVRIQKASLEEQLRNSQQDMARWRFESLKSRCILINREHILTENNISFKPIQAMEYNISEKEQQEAKPRIVSKRRSSTFGNIVERESMTPLKMPLKEDVESPLQNITEDINSMSFISNTKIENNQNISGIDINISENIVKSIIETSLCKDINVMAIKEENHADVRIIYENETKRNEDKENYNNIYDVDYSILDNFSMLKAEPPSPMRSSQRSLEQASTKANTPPARSILGKQNDLLFKDSGKNVKFSSNPVIIHDINPDTPSQDSTTYTPTDKNNANSSSNSKANSKQSRTKSKSVVRRVIVSSKHF